MQEVSTTIIAASMVTTLAQRLRKKSMRLLTRRSDLERKAEREAEREAERAERRERARHMSFFSISFSSCFHFTRLSPRLVVFFCRGKIIRKKEGNNERGSWIFFFFVSENYRLLLHEGRGNRKSKKKGKRRGGNPTTAAHFPIFFSRSSKTSSIHQEASFPCVLA